MKHYFILLLLLFTGINYLEAQEIPTVMFDTLQLDFIKVNENRIRITKSRLEENQIMSIPIVQNSFDAIQKDSSVAYTYQVKVVDSGTTLLGTDFNLTSSLVKIHKEKTRQQFFLEIKKDSITDRDRKILLKIELMKNKDEIDVSNLKSYYELEILVKSVSKPLDGYEYLAYVGTNFDLVEGIKAKDLFFAGNILSKPSRFNKRNVGFYLSLYGNRAFSQVDSTGFFRENQVYEQLSDSTYLSNTNQDTYLSNRITDNIGAYISPLFQIKWFKTKNPKNNLFLYYSPSLEFVYRRTTLTREKLGSRTIEREVINGNFSDVEFLNQEQPNFSEVFNEYSFNAGIIALFMCLENERISVRVHGSVGYTSNYYREFNPQGVESMTKQKSDIFFSGRAWITESKTGITLQAEVTNNMINPRPFFVATLSKAINFSQLGSVFKPVINQ